MLRPGVTLIELLISSTIVAMLLLGITSLASLGRATQRRAQDEFTVHENLRYAVARLSSHVTEASGIAAPALGDTSSTLTLLTTSSSTNPTRIELENGVSFISQGTSTRSPVSSREIEITRMDFTRVSSTVPGIRFVVNAKPRDETPSRILLSATTTILIRW